MKGIWAVAFIFSILVLGTFTPGLAFAAPDKDLESECAKKKNDFDALFCEALLGFLGLFDRFGGPDNFFDVFDTVQQKTQDNMMMIQDIKEDIQCSGHGFEDSTGTCVCNEGFSGVDCSELDPGEDQTCPPGQFVTGLTADGGIICSGLPTCEEGDLECVCEQFPDNPGCFCFQNPDHPECVESPCEQDCQAVADRVHDVCLGANLGFEVCNTVSEVTFAQCTERFCVEPPPTSCEETCVELSNDFTLVCTETQPLDLCLAASSLLNSICLQEQCTGPPPVCAPPQTDCSGACVDLSTDLNHCGQCGQACEQGLSCVAGTCELQCPGDTVQCGSFCVDTQNDPSNCGGCSQACSPGQSCEAGHCSSPFDGAWLVQPDSYRTSCGIFGEITMEYDISTITTSTEGEDLRISVDVGARGSIGNFLEHVVLTGRIVGNSFEASANGDIASYRVSGTTSGDEFFGQLSINPTLGLNCETIFSEISGIRIG